MGEFPGVDGLLLGKSEEDVWDPEGINKVVEEETESEESWSLDLTIEG